MSNVVATQSFSMSDIERVALAIAKGGLFGSSDPNAVLTLCLLAQAEGQHPAVVFRDYHIIQGKPAKKAEAMLRDFIASGGKVEWHTMTDDLADATFSHPSGGTIRIDWTVKRAQHAGISTPMWKKYPRQMLRSRVISEGVRAVCPSATSGLYETGEVQDIIAGRPMRVVNTEPQTGDVTQLEPVTLRDQLEQSVAEAAPEAVTWTEPGSMYSGIHKLKTGLRRLNAELEGCGDSEMVYGVTGTDEWKEFVRVAEKHSPHYLRGGPPAPEEFEGLISKAERLVAGFDSAEANHVMDVARS